MSSWPIQGTVRTNKSGSLTQVEWWSLQYKISMSLHWVQECTTVFMHVKENLSEINHHGCPSTCALPNLPHIPTDTHLCRLHSLLGCQEAAWFIFQLLLASQRPIPGLSRKGSWGVHVLIFEFLNWEDGQFHLLEKPKSKLCVWSSERNLVRVCVCVCVSLRASNWDSHKHHPNVSYFSIGGSVANFSRYSGGTDSNCSSLAQRSLRQSV